MHNTPQTLVETDVVVPLTTFTASPSTEVTSDCRGFSEAIITLVCGTFTSSATMDVAIYEDTASNGASATAISGAAFAQVSTSNDVAVYVARVNLQKTKRYLIPVCTHAGTGDAPITVLVQKIGPRDTAIANQSYAFSVGD